MLFAIWIFLYLHPRCRVLPLKICGLYSTCVNLFLGKSKNKILKSVMFFVLFSKYWHFSKSLRISICYLCPDFYASMLRFLLFCWVFLFVGRLSAQVFDTVAQTESCLWLRSIDVSGDRRTKDHIIFRELSVQPGNC